MCTILFLLSTINIKYLRKECESMKKAVIVTQAGLARKLIKEGEELIDIKPHKSVPNASIFLFKPSKSIEQILQNNIINKR